MTAFKHLTVWN